MDLESRKKEEFAQQINQLKADLKNTLSELSQNSYDLAIFAFHLKVTDA